MTARFPQGLVRVVDATHVDEPSDSADVIYQRKLALHNFWRVHNLQAKVSRDAVNIRCSQLFWRVWGDRRLSTSLSQDTLMRLWFQFQRDFDLSPFQLRIKNSTEDKGKSREVISTYPVNVSERRQSQTSSVSSASTISISPRYPPSGKPTEGLGHASSTQSKQKSSLTVPEPGNLVRSDSNESKKKRQPQHPGSSRGRARPSIPRKRSSQTEKCPEPAKPRRSIIKSPRSSNSSSTGFATPLESENGTTAQPSPSIAPQDLPTSNIATFELPSASSWQSIDSHTEPAQMQTQASPSADTLVIDRNFRERFMQKTRNSSTNLANMNRSMRKTGSVVRFADEVELATSTSLKKSASATDRKSVPLSPQSALRTSSESKVATVTGGNPVNLRPWRPSGIERHDSIGSVAAVSDDGSDGLEEGGELPRTQSHLSLGIADLKRTLSSGNLEDLKDDENAITSPTIEEEQEALIKGQKGKSLTKEEENLLAMGRKDGVTRAGGVNMPSNLTIKGKFQTPDFGEQREASHF